MGIIKLTKNDPIVLRATSLNTFDLTEVGFIPGDVHGCKIYATGRAGKILTIIGMHSRAYGCNREPKTDGVDIQMYQPRVEQLTFDFAFGLN